MDTHYKRYVDFNDETYTYAMLPDFPISDNDSKQVSTGVKLNKPQKSKRRKRNKLQKQSRKQNRK